MNWWIPSEHQQWTRVHNSGYATSKSSEPILPVSSVWILKSDSFRESVLPRSHLYPYTFTETLRGWWRIETGTGGRCRHRRPVGRGVLCEVDFAIGSVDNLVVVAHDNGL